MRFRPCIDLHRGKVKQIVGSTFSDADDTRIRTNFQTDRPAGDFAAMYRDDGLAGGHVIMLGPGNEQAAIEAVRAYPGGLQVGGGITPDTASRYIDAGASHVIVTSYVFRDGRIEWQNLEQISRSAGACRLVIDVSCTRRNGHYLVVTDRWQKVSSEVVDAALLARLRPYCDELLVHAVDVEGMQGGVDEELISLLAQVADMPATYAGGVRTLADLERIERAGGGLVDATVGSALDIFGGQLPYRDVVEWHRTRTSRP